MSGLVVMAYVLGIGFCIVAYGISAHRTRRREVNAAMRRHPAGKGRRLAPVTTPATETAHNPRNPCTSTGCAYPASVWVIVAEDLGGGVRHVCQGCHDEGTAHKWWRASLGGNPSALDFEIADDLDRIEAWANGEAS